MRTRFIPLSIIWTHLEMSQLQAMPKIGYRAAEAARYLGISQAKFQMLVKERRLPRARRIDGCVVWRGDELCDAFINLTDGDRPATNTLDDILGFN
jgi:predicted DNA-binding transcriptional regulator AlpA